LFSADYGVPQLRPRALLVAFREAYWNYFQWPAPARKQTKTVGEALYELMSENGWEGAEKWKLQANDIAPTLVGGSKKHGGADLVLVWRSDLKVKSVNFSVRQGAFRRAYPEVRPRKATQYHRKSGLF
jgi:site-specific DNA-cytosine methylase